MENTMYEVFCDGVSLKRLFLTEENALLWIKTHPRYDGRRYSVRPYLQSKKEGG